ECCQSRSRAPRHWAGPYASLSQIDHRTAATIDTTASSAQMIVATIGTFCLYSDHVPPRNSPPSANSHTALVMRAVCQAVYKSQRLRGPTPTSLRSSLRGSLRSPTPLRCSLGRRRSQHSLRARHAQVTWIKGNRVTQRPRDCFELCLDHVV